MEGGAAESAAVSYYMHNETRTAPRKKAYRLKAPIVREHPLQKQITDVLRIEIAPPGKVSDEGVVWWAIDHANYAGEVPGVRASRGIIAGVFDMFLCYLGHAHQIEVKAEDGVMSDEQMSVGAAVFSAGGKIAIARNADEVLICIDTWKIPRKHRIEPQK
jgi:hypothetical protein